MSFKFDIEIDEESAPIKIEVIPTPNFEPPTILAPELKNETLDSDESYCEVWFKGEIQGYEVNMHLQGVIFSVESDQDVVDGLEYLIEENEVLENILSKIEIYQKSKKTKKPFLGNEED